MSTSLIYHAFGAPGHRYLKTSYDNGNICIHIEKKPDKIRCANCRGRRVTQEGRKAYPLRTLSIGFKPVFLVLHVRRLRCKDCKAVRQETRQIALPRKSYTRQFARYVQGMARSMTLKDIAVMLKVSWHLVRDIVSSCLARQAKRRSWAKVRYLAIDEIAVRKGHHYLTVVADLESGRVLEVCKGRRAETLKPVFNRLKRAKAPLVAVAMDMSPAYLKAVRQYAPEGVAVVHDPFHLVRLMNRALDEVRRWEYRRASAAGKKVLKGNRFLLLYGREKLEKKPDKKTRLDRLLALNERLAKVYLLKEDFRLLWLQQTKKEASVFLKRWLEQARSLDLVPLKPMITAVQNHAASILAWYDHPITNGPLEGLNNKIKVLKRRGYGYRNFDFFRLLLLFIHDTEFKLSGT